MLDLQGMEVSQAELELQAEVASLSAQLTMAQEALKVATDRYVRLNADFDNFRKRTVRQSGSFSQA